MTSQTVILEGDKIMNSVSRVNPLDSYPYSTWTTVGASQAAMKGDNQRPSASVAPTAFLPLPIKGPETGIDGNQDDSGFNAFA
jgi:hypothetical protein